MSKSRRFGFATLLAFDLVLFAPLLVTRGVYSSHDFVRAHHPWRNGPNGLLEAENRSLTGGGDAELIAESPAMRPVLETIERVAPTDANVLITGESGCGKGLVARLIHERSARSARSFVTVNIGSLAETVFESKEALDAAMRTPQWEALRADAAVMHERFGVTLANGLGNPVAVELTAVEPGEERRAASDPSAGPPAPER